MKSHSFLVITKPSIIVIFFILLSGNIYAQDQIATLANGKKVILHSDKTWEYSEGGVYDYDFSKIRDNEIPSFLRQGIKVDRQTLVIAIEMYLQGWRYTMPSPKSSQASWGNHDRRTTWWHGYWNNTKTNKFSRITPDKHSDGYYYGDGQNDKGYWRNGGSPGTPSKIEWLLSSSGGIFP